jgi:hypothetical protein
MCPPQLRKKGEKRNELHVIRPSELQGQTIIRKLRSEERLTFQSYIGRKAIMSRLGKGL